MLEITITGDGLNLKREVNMHQAGQIISFLSISGGSPGSGEPEGETSRHLVEGSLILSQGNSNPSDEIDASNASTYAEKIVVIGNFLIKRNGSQTFSIEEVKTELKKLGEFPSKFSRELKNAIDLQYIYGSKKDGYEVTVTGQKAISGKFTDQQGAKNKSKSTTKNKSKLSKKTSTKLDVREKLAGMEIGAELEGVGSYHDSKLKKQDKILWILQYAYQEGIDGLNAKEVEFISDKLREIIPMSSFSALNKRNITSTFVKVSGREFKIQKKGEDYLRDLLNRDESK